MVGPDTTGQMKIVSGATEITDGISANIIWIENAIALAKIASWNVDAANYIANLDTFDNLKISFRYGAAGWTEYFDGIIEDVNPILKNNEKTIACTAYDQARCLRNTKNNTSYGSESQNPTLDTPTEIWTDMETNYVEKSFGGAATGYSLVLSVNNATTPTIKFIPNLYRPNIELLNLTLLLIQASRAGATGHHWIMGADGTLRIKRIDTDIAGWPMWWNTNEAGSTLVEGTDFIEYSFSKRVRTKDFANKIILSTDLRKPGYDYVTEGAVTKSLWGDDGNVTLSDSATKIVGSDSLLAIPDGGAMTEYWYPSAKNAGWDLTKIGSIDTVPALNFWVRVNKDKGAVGAWMRLFTQAGSSYDMYAALDSAFISTANEWTFVKVPVGPYFMVGQDASAKGRWVSAGGGAEDWANINWISVRLPDDNTYEVYLDDLHFSGKIIREAYNSTNITANDEVQKLVRMGTAVDDSMKAATDTGLAARIGYAELLRAQTLPVVGTTKLYGIVDILPGQKVHIHAEKTNGSFKVDDTFRIKQVQQEFYGFHEFYTTLTLTDDLVNTFAKGPAEAIDALHNVLFVDPEAQSLKATGLDPLVPRLSKDYP